MISQNKFSKTLWAVLMLSGAALPFTSCNNCNQTAPAEFAVDSVSWIDSLSTAQSSAYCTIKLDNPSQGDVDLLRNIREWIGDRLGGTFSAADVSQNDFISQYGQSLLDSARHDFQSLEEADLGVNYDWNLSFRKADETEQFVTYTFDIYTYSGGAHGSYLREGATFRKQDGRKFGWDMFKADTQMELSQLVKKAIQTQYFGSGSDDEFYSQLLNGDTYKECFPLPQTAPFLTQEGVNFIYQQYEITPYSAGSPSCVLPFEQVKEMLTKPATELFP